MAFASPTPFAEALAWLRRKRLLPTADTTAQIGGWDKAVRERSFFSAQQLREDALAILADKVDRVLNPTTEIRDDGTPYTKGLNFVQARAEAQAAFREAGVLPMPGTEGGNLDHTSDVRVDLVIRMNTEMAQGFGYHQAGQTAEALELYPCWEFFRAEERKVPRDWPGRWVAAAKAVGDDDALTCFERTGRMVARKDSPIWVELSAFGTPYPPFDFNSGMDLRAVPRDEAVALGVINELAVIRPTDANFDLPEAA